VKQALIYLAESGAAPLPHVPQPLAMVLLDSVVEWGIDIVVLQLNRYDLWEVAPVPRSISGRIRETLSRGIRKLLLAAGNAVAVVILWIRRLHYRSPVLSPALQQALDAVRRESAIGTEQDLILRVSQLFIWLGTHRTVLVQATELIFGAVEEAENVLNMTGEKKKQLAEDLIWRVLGEMGFTSEPGIFAAILHSAIDLLIEMAVHFFNKRGAFQHRCHRAVSEA
jgi:hypothetical protein